MAYSQADVDVLEAAIASGARDVEFGAGPDKRRVEYRSLDEMFRSLTYIKTQIAPAAAAPRISFVRHSRD